MSVSVTDCAPWLSQKHFVNDLNQVILQMKSAFGCGTFFRAFKTVAQIRINCYMDQVSWFAAWYG